MGCQLRFGGFMMTLELGGQGDTRSEMSMP